MVIFILFFTFIIVSYSQHLDGSWKEKLTIGDQTRADIYVRSFFSGHPIAEQILIMLCFVVFWFRLFYLMRFNETFASISLVTEHIFPVLTMYVYFYIINIVFFTGVAQLGFQEVPEYADFRDGFLRLFYSGFG